jgi:hypothetical protein
MALDVIQYLLPIGSEAINQSVLADKYMPLAKVAKTLWRICKKFANTLSNLPTPY